MRLEKDQGCILATLMTEQGYTTWSLRLLTTAVDEALAGYCDLIEITIHQDDSITIKDNGRGIPVDKHKIEKKISCRGYHDSASRWR